MTEVLKTIGRGLLAVAMLGGPALAQAVPAQGTAPAVPPPAPVQSAPLPPPGAAPPEAASASPAPQVPAPQVPAPQAPAPQVPAPQVPAPPAPATPATSATARPTLLPTPGDPVDVDDVTIPAKPAAVLAGTSTWDDGFAALKRAFERVEEELRKAGIAPAGRPVTVFVQTDDLGFRYEAMVPIERVPEGRAALGGEVRFGTIPGGRALRFVHKGPYEDIDSTYETITAYLDAKGVTVKDVFIEEYATDLTDPADAALEINIFAVPR